jgi:hypothetical protein
MEINLKTNKIMEIIQISGEVQLTKRMYSGEEVLELLITCKNKFGGSGLEDYTHDDEVKEWFEQIKNK